MYDEDLEKVMLYYMIFEQADYLLDEADFFIEKNKKIIKAINELKAEKKEVDMLSVKSKINSNSTDILIYLSGLIDYTYGTNPDQIYNKLISLSKKRKMLKLLNENIKNIKDVEDVDIFSETIIKDINKIQTINEKEKTFLQQVVDTTQEIEKKTQQETDYSLYTGMIDLDKLICGLHNEELTIVGARPRGRKDNFCITNSREYR